MIMQLPDSARLALFSVAHWEEQLKEVEQYCKTVDRKFEGKRFVNYSREFQRAEELVLSSVDRRDYVRMRVRRMKTHGPIINGINFGRMLDEVKTDLHKSIDARFAEDRAKCDQEDKEDAASRRLMDALRDSMFRVKHRWPIGPGEPITSLGQAMKHAATAFNDFYNAVAQAGKPIPKFKTGTPVINHESMIRSLGVRIDDHLAKDATTWTPGYYGAGGRYVSTRCPHWAEIVLQHIKNERVFFVCTFDQWRLRSTKILPDLNVTTIIKGQLWRRIK